MMDYAKILTKLAAIMVALALIAACGEGYLEVTPEQNAPTQDAGFDDVGTNGDDDAGTNGDDVGVNQNNQNQPQCCDIGAIECVDDHSHRECLDDGQGCGQWDEATTCPNQQLCDDRDGAEELCTACRDDDFAPDNFVSPTAPTLNKGSSFSDLVLCDNGEPDLTSHNFFYLGQEASIDVTLTWDESDGALGMDFWTAEAADSNWEGRTYLADAGQGASELHHTQSLGSTEHLFARVYFRTDNPPTAGIGYTLSHND